MQATDRLQQAKPAPGEWRANIEFELVVSKGDRMRTQVKAFLVAMSLGLAIMAPAKAAIFNITPLDMYPTTVPGVQFSFISNVFTVANNAFTDLWTFDISGAGAQGGGNVAALSTQITGSSISQSPLPLRLRLLAWDGDGYDTVLSDSGLAPIVGPSVLSSLAAHAGGDVGHGYYALEVSGTTPAASVLSQYSGQLQVAAVPEPSTYALLAAGLLVAGFKLRRYSA